MNISCDMNDDVINIHLVEWDGDMIARVCRCLNGRTERAVRGKAVSLLTGAYASVLFYDGRIPDRIISHQGNGKPYMEGFPDITVSISHCRRTAAVSLSPICHGIDIELPRPVRDGMIRHVFNADEQAMYLSLPPEERHRLFIRLWTRKEALVKTGAITLGGMNLVSAAEDVAEFNGTEYFFSTEAVGEHILSLCCRSRRAGMNITQSDIISKEKASEALERLYFDKGE